MGNADTVDKTILLEQYKLYVEMADRISQRRQSANNYFLTINTFLLSFFAFFSKGSSSIPVLVGLISLAGITLCYVWYRLITSYKGLNSGKFKVIHEMEKLLGYAPYDIEWEKLGCGENKKLYLPFTNIEPYIPGVFGVLYIVSILTLIPWKSLFDSFCS